MDVAFRTESQSTLKYIFRLGNEQSPTSGPRRMHIGQSLISLLSGMRRHSVTGGPGDRGTQWRSSRQDSKRARLVTLTDCQRESLAMNRYTMIRDEKQDAVPCTEFFFLSNGAINVTINIEQICLISFSLPRRTIYFVCSEQCLRGNLLNFTCLHFGRQVKSCI